MSPDQFAEIMLYLKGDEERVVSFFQCAPIGTAETIFRVIKGIMRNRQTPSPQTITRKKRRPRVVEGERATDFKVATTGTE